MAGSAAEREIRTAVVARLHELMPGARIVHELNVSGQGSRRIDVAAVAEYAIVAIEIKSEKDKLDRLDDQWTAFNACCHKVIVAAHEKHFASWRADWWAADGRNDVLLLNHPLFRNERAYWRHDEDVWRYPRPERGQPPMGTIWDLPRSISMASVGAMSQPRAANMLEMLWAAELRDECATHHLGMSVRSPRDAMIGALAWHLTGRQLAAAVCRQLRARNFAEADAPIDEVAA